VVNTVRSVDLNAPFKVESTGLLISASFRLRPQATLLGQEPNNVNDIDWAARVLWHDSSIKSCFTGSCSHFQADRPASERSVPYVREEKWTVIQLHWPKTATEATRAFVTIIFTVTLCISASEHQWYQTLCCPTNALYYIQMLNCYKPITRTSSYSEPHKRTLGHNMPP